MLPQFEQKASPAGFTEPHDGHIWVPAEATASEAGSGAAVDAGAAAVATGAALARGSPHSSQKADPSGFS